MSSYSISSEHFSSHNIHEYSTCPSRNPNSAPTGPDHSYPKEKFAKPLSSGVSRWTVSRRLHTVIIGFFLLSLTSAVINCCFFVHLDGRILSAGIEASAKTTTIPQGYATTISFLLATAFRAALAVSIGVCYTQYLWATLREHVLQTGLVEDLFQIQTNVFNLVSFRAYTQTPILVVIAMFCWLVPIATVYPPAALIVGLHTTSIETTFNVSAFCVHNPENNTNYLSRVRCFYPGDPQGLWTTPAYPRDADLLINAFFLETCYTTIGKFRETFGDDFVPINKDASYITRSALMSGEIERINQPAEGNVSSSLEFWGTTLQCETVNCTVDKVIPKSIITSGYSYYTEWDDPDLFYYSSLKTNSDPQFLSANTIITYRFAPVKNISEYQYYPCLHSINGSLDEKPLEEFDTLPDAGIHILLPVAETDFLNFNGSFGQWVQFSDAMTVYDEFALNLGMSVGYHGRLDYGNTLPSKGVQSYSMKNGTTVNTCLVHADQTRFEGVNGTTSRTDNMYRFRNKLGFFLPYGLALGLAILMMALGLSAFFVRNQGVSATGGGFLQLLLTTTGRTDLETIITKDAGTMGGYENISKELKETKIRLGRLIEYDEKDGEGRSSVIGRLSTHDEYATDATRYSSDTQDNQEQSATSVEVSEGSKTTSRRVGFGMVHEVEPFRKKALD